MRLIFLCLLVSTIVLAQFPFYQNSLLQSTSCGCQYTPPSTPITTVAAPGTPVRRRKVLRRFWRFKRSTDEGPLVGWSKKELNHCSSRILKKTLDQVLQSNSFNHSSTVTDLTVSLVQQGVLHPGVVCGIAPIYFSMDSRDYCSKYDKDSKWECYLFMLD